MLLFFFLICSLTQISFLDACSSSGISGKFNNEKGDFELSWCKEQSNEAMEFTVSMKGNSFVALGFGGSMFDADIIAAYYSPSKQDVIVQDYYSNAEAKPSTDESLGGTNDIQVISTSRDENYIKFTFTRKLVTGDKYDKEISLTAANDMIYAWNSDASSEGISYHGDNHNHVFIDFTKENGIPDSTFGQEESGKLSRQMIQESYYGTLSTWQSEAAGSSQVSNFPFGTVVDFADNGDGKPIILLSNLERSVINMQTYASCSLSVLSAPNTTIELNHPELYDVMTKPRTTLLGALTKVPASEIDAAKSIYLSKHPMAKAWIGFSDFALYYFDVQDVYVVAGFGNTHYIGWISSSQYFSVKL